MRFIPVPDIDLDVVSLRALILLGIIHGFTRQGRTCFSDNETLASKLKVSPRQVGRLLTELETKGLINPVYGSENTLIGWRAAAQITSEASALDGTKSAKDVIYPQGVDKSVDNSTKLPKQQGNTKVGTIPALIVNNNILPKGIPLGGSLKGITLNHKRSSKEIDSKLVSNIIGSETPFSFSGEGAMKIEIEGTWAEHVKRNLQESGAFERTNAFMMAGRRPMVRWPDLWLTPQELHSVFEYLDEHITDTKWSKVFEAAQAEAVTQKLKGKDTSLLNAYRYLTTFAAQNALDTVMKSRANKNSIRRTIG